MSAQLTSGGSGGGGGQQMVDVAELELPQLQDVRQQLEQELKHLTSSFGQLKSAQAKFRSCIESIANITPASKGEAVVARRPAQKAETVGLTHSHCC